MLKDLFFDFILRKITGVQKTSCSVLWLLWLLKLMLWSMAKAGQTGKWFNLGPKGGISKKKIVGKCYNCGGMGHKASVCKKPKKNGEGNMVDDISKDVSDMNLSAVVSEVNLVGSNPNQWWVDTGATRHMLQ